MVEKRLFAVFTANLRTWSSCCVGPFPITRA